jgi:hypothetical protein
MKGFICTQPVGVSKATRADKKNAIRVWAGGMAFGLLSLKGMNS